MTAQERMDKVVQLLTDHGFTHVGATATQHVRIPTTQSPVFGKSGGVNRTLGGRAKFAKGKQFVTVGKRTTFFYWQKPDHRSAVFYTSEFEAIKSFLEVNPWSTS